jgi:hypothetical protein
MAAGGFCGGNQLPRADGQLDASGGTSVDADANEVDRIAYSNFRGGQFGGHSGLKADCRVGNWIGRLTAFRE